MPEPTTPEQAMLRAHRMRRLAILSGIYRFPGHYPEVERILDNKATSPAVVKLIQSFRDLGVNERKRLGLADSELEYSVIPYQLWTAY